MCSRMVSFPVLQCICSDSQLLNLCGCGSFLPYVEMAKLLRMRKVCFQNNLYTTAREIWHDIKIIGDFVHNCALVLCLAKMSTAAATMSVR